MDMRELVLRLGKMNTSPDALGSSGNSIWSVCDALIHFPLGNRTIIVLLSGRLYSTGDDVTRKCPEQPESIMSVWTSTGGSTGMLY